MATTRHRIWRYIRGLAAPALLWCILVVALVQLSPAWLGGDDEYDQRAMREWIDEAGVSREPLPQMVGDYLNQVAKDRADNPNADPLSDPLLLLRAGKIEEHLTPLGSRSKRYRNLSRRFPTIYRL